MIKIRLSDKDSYLVMETELSEEEVIRQLLMSPSNSDLRSIKEDLEEIYPNDYISDIVDDYLEVEVSEC